MNNSRYEWHKEYGHIYPGDKSKDGGWWKLNGGHYVRRVREYEAPSAGFDIMWECYTCRALTFQASAHNTWHVDNNHPAPPAPEKKS
jgi:hypothetical protein